MHSSAEASDVMAFRVAFFRFPPRPEGVLDNGKCRTSHTSVGPIFCFSATYSAVIQDTWPPNMTVKSLDWLGTSYIAGEVSDP